GGDLAAEDVLHLLARLVSKSLIVLIVSETSKSSPAQYRLLETVRAYAGEHLEATGEAAARRAVHARFYLNLAEEAEPYLTGPSQKRWLERLEAESANFHYAVEWSLGHGETEQALRLAGALVLYWRVRCHFSEGRDMLEAAVAASEGAAPGLRAKALWGVGFLSAMTGALHGAIPALEESLSLARDLGDTKGCGRALLLLGNCAQARSDPRAQSLLEESATLAREAGDRWCLAHALAMAGFDYNSRSDLAAARPLFEESLLVAREAEDKQGLRFGLMGLGSVAYREGDFWSAESLLEEVVSLTWELGEDYIRAMALECLGQLTMARGDYGRAAEIFDEALALIRDVGQPLALPNLLAARARAAHANGDRSHARVLLEDALALARTGKGSPIPALRAMGHLAADEGDVSTAEQLLDEALKLARMHGDKAGIAQALQGLGRLARARGDSKRAAVLHDEALELWREIGSAPGTVASIEAIGGLRADDGRHRHAARLLGAAKALRDENGYARLPWESARYEADVALIRQGLTVKELQTTFAEGAALPLAEAIRQASNGRGPRERSPTGWPSLTDRERQLAALVAEGLTNPQIADRLFVSLGTVKFHLSRIFRKLGVTGRSELVREVWRRGGDPPSMNQ
ncbi:MAG: tetratricopeptide repeat protein, partial [Actinobacteria bacterium]|nr:tetratricopeptide repeat protein [Actinomycetota bacterium]